MNKTILIPTDFTVKSLGLVRLALERNEEGINLVLAHGTALGTSISDLLFLSRRKLLEPLIGEEFGAAIQMLHSKYGSRIGRIFLEVFTGNTRSAFRNFLEGNRIDEAYISPGYLPRFRREDSFDLLPYIKKSGIPTREFPWGPAPVLETVVEQETVADLFFAHMRPSLNK